MFYARIVSEEGEVVFSGKFDKVDFVRKKTPHPLYPEKALKEDRDTVKITDAGEYIVLLSKHDDEIDCPVVEDLSPGLPMHQTEDEEADAWKHRHTPYY